MRSSVIACVRASNLENFYPNSSRLEPEDASHETPMIRPNLIVSGEYHKTGNGSRFYVRVYRGTDPLANFDRKLLYHDVGGITLKPRIVASKR